MRNYLIVVEGAHDIAVIEKLLRLNGINQKINTEKELPVVWRHTIPTRYPFKADRLERITPIPSFLKNTEISVAIKNAGSDTEIMHVLQQTLHSMEINELAEIDAVMMICDADNKTAEEKRQELLSSIEEREDFSLNLDSMELDIKIKKIPVHTFIFPNDSDSGNLENLLLETAEVTYPQLLELASEYVEKAAIVVQDRLKREQEIKKAKVGCVANVMKPGKANQISIADDNWVSEETLEKCGTLKTLNLALKKMIAI